MLQGIKIISGSIQFEEKKDQDEQLLFEALEILSEVIDNNFDYDSYNHTKRFNIGHYKEWEPTIDTGELYSVELAKGERVSIYSHSRYFNMERLMDAYQERLDEIPMGYRYNDIAFEVSYTEIEFAKDSQEIEEVRKGVRTGYIRAEKDRPVDIIQKVLHSEMVESFSIMDLERDTNLLAFTTNSYVGTVNIYEHLLVLYDKPDVFPWFYGFGNPNTKMVAKFLSNDNKEQAEKNKESKFYRNTRVLRDILAGTMDKKKFRVGTPELMDYMETASPIILGHIMENGDISSS